MFNLKHQIILNTSEKIHLFGEDYFGDKKVFWETHQSILKDLCQKVCKTGFPIIIKDLHSDKELEITNKETFDNWLKENQPFTCKCEE